MALSIKDEDTDRLVRRYAQIKGVSYTRAIRLAVTDALAREQALPVGTSFAERIRPIQDRVKARPRDTSLSEDEILGYGEDGLPA